MEPAINDHRTALRADATVLFNDAVGASIALRDSSRQEIGRLMTDVQDLVSHLAHVADPEIVRLRTEVENGLSQAKTAIVRRAADVQRQATEALSAGDRYVHDRPWKSIGIAVGLGLAVGILAARR